MDEGKTPLLLGKFHETMWGGGEGRRIPRMGPPSLPQNVMLLFYGLPIYVFPTDLIDFSFLKIGNGNHTRLPIPQIVEIAHFICYQAVRSPKRSPPRKRKSH